MHKHFLIGNFLPAYGEGFGRMKRVPSQAEGLGRDVLAKRFRDRAVAYRTRRSEYVRGIQFGLVGALALAAAAFNVSYSPSSDVDFKLTEQEIVAMEEIVQTLQQPKPPPPPRPMVPVAVPDDDILEDEELLLDMSLDLEAAVTDLPPPPPMPKEEEAYEPEIFMVVEQMPEMVGGIQAMLRTLTYPELARKAGLDGVVVVQVVIDREGNASSPKVIKSVHQVLDDEAVRAVMAQRFIPGRQRGRAVSVAMNIPVTFRLN